MTTNRTLPPPAPDRAEEATATFDIRRLSPQQLAQLGVSQIAYVRAIETDTGPAFAIHAADGTPIALADNRDVAIAAIRQHEMTPALVH